MTRAVAYIRVSTDKQADHGISLEAQRAKIEAYAALYDVELVSVEVDAGVSAKSLDRPGLTAALAMLRSGKADALLVVKLDRLTRSVRDLCDLLEMFRDGKRALLSVTETVDTRTAMGRGVLSIMSSIGQIEREQVGERTAAVMAHLAEQGRYTGGKTPYGYQLADDGETLAPVEAEQAVIATARELRSSGLSLRKVAQALDERGHRARNGNKFQPTQIMRIASATA